MTKVNQNNGIGAKSDFFSWDIFKSDSIFIGRITVKYFHDFYN